VLASIGASGDAREPHLHFEVTTSSKLLAGEGVPYLIDRYRCKSTTDGTIELRIRELPLDKSIVLFGTDHGRGNEGLVGLVQSQLLAKRTSVVKLA
jgi:hypothetical protein